MTTDKRAPDDLQEAVAATLRRLRGEVRSQNQTGAQLRTEPRLSAPAPLPPPVAAPVAAPAAQPVATPAAEPDLLSGSEPEIPPSPRVRPLLRETQTSFLEEQAKKPRLSWLPYALSFVALAVFAGIVWWAYHAVVGAHKNGPVPVIAADQTPEKVPPADQNAADTAAPDKTVYDQISGTNTQPKTEVLLPAPATPQVPPPPPAPSPTLPAASGTESGVPPAEPTAPATAAIPAVPAVPAVPSTPPAAPPAPVPPAAPAITTQSTTTPTAPTPAATTPATTTPAASSTAAATGAAASSADLSGVPTLSPVSPAVSATPATPAPSTGTTTASNTGTTSNTTATTPTQTAAIPDNYRIQVAAVKNEADASKLWKQVQSKHEDVLGPLTVYIVRADLGTQGIYYRIQAGPFADKDSARQACDTLKAQGQQCLVKP